WYASGDHCFAEVSSIGCETFSFRLKTKTENEIEKKKKKKKATFGDQTKYALKKFFPIEFRSDSIRRNKDGLGQHERRIDLLPFSFEVFETATLFVEFE